MTFGTKRINNTLVHMMVWQPLELSIMPQILKKKSLKIKAIIANFLTCVRVLVNRL